MKWGLMVQKGRGWSNHACWPWELEVKWTGDCETLLGRSTMTLPSWWLRFLLLFPSLLSQLLLNPSWAGTSLLALTLHWIAHEMR